MTITITTQEVMDFFNAREEFADSEMPLKGAYKLNKITKECSSVADMFQQKFNEILEKFADRDADGNMIYNDEDQTQVRIAEGKMDECNAELEALLSEEVEIDNQNLKLEDLGEDFESTPRTVETIFPFFTE